MTIEVLCTLHIQNYTYFSQIPSIHINNIPLCSDYRIYEIYKYFFFTKLRTTSFKVHNHKLHRRCTLSNTHLYTSVMNVLNLDPELGKAIKEIAKFFKVKIEIRMCGSLEKFHIEHESTFISVYGIKENTTASDFLLWMNSIDEREIEVICDCINEFKNKIIL